MAKTFSFIGLGLIGGSIAKALRANMPDCRIRACDTCPASLEEALADKVADETYAAPENDFFACDYLFLCAPVSNNDALLSGIGKQLSPDTVITDVGSVKQTTHTAIEKAGLADRFIGGHPMAGSEKIGYSHSNPLLLENAYYILTPTSSVPAVRVKELEGIIAGIGAIPLILDYEKHDRITAAVSHLPHIIAASLVNLVKDSDDADGLMKMIAAGGFKDITRIASSSPAMWQAICMTNTENIRDLLSDYITSLSEIKRHLELREKEDIYALFDTAKEYRDSFAEASHGPIKKVYAIHVDIPDVPGSIAQTATLLALRSLSIQNIGIMHSREFQEGALRIEFYDEATANEAADVLRKHGYQIYD